MNDFSNIEHIRNLQLENEKLNIEKNKLKQEYNTIKKSASKKRIRILKQEYLRTGLRFTKNKKKLNIMKQIVQISRQNHIYRRIDELLKIYINDTLTWSNKRQVITTILNDSIRYTKNKKVTIFNILSLFRL